MYPNISEWQKKQAAFLDHKFVPDLQLKSLLDFVDINDPSMISTIYQSMATVYEKMSESQYELNLLADDVAF